MIASEPAGHPATSPYLHGYGCGCRALAGSAPVNPHSGEVVMEPQGINLWPQSKTKTYVRFCDFSPLTHTVLKSPAMDATRPLDAGSGDPVEDETYEVVRLATPVAKAGGVVGQGLQNGKFEPVWALIRKPGAKTPLNTFDGNGWALLYLRVRADEGQAPLADYRDGLPYKTVDISFGETSAKSSVKPDGKYCNVNRTLLAILDEKLAKPATGDQGDPKDTSKDTPKDTPKAKAKEAPQAGGTGVLLAIGAAVGLYLLTKR